MAKTGDQTRKNADERPYLTGSLVLLEFDFVSMSTFNLIFM